jgi:hypothetical protein
MGKARNQGMRRQLWQDLLLNLARDLVRHRPNRREPRAVKRRPKPYPLLNRPRHQFVEISHRGRYLERAAPELPRAKPRAIQNRHLPNLFGAERISKRWQRVAGG